MEAKNFYLKRSRELTHLSSVISALAWDQEVMMPSEGVEHRARQSATLAAIHHERLTDPALTDALSTLRDKEDQQDPKTRAGVAELWRQHEKALRLPEQLVREMAEVSTHAYTHWVTARTQSDFSLFAPWLARILGLKREQALCLKQSDSLYESLLDDYEPGAKEGQLRTLFAQIRPNLTKLLDQLQTRQAIESIPSLEGEYPLRIQEAFGKEVLTAMGFDWSAGRLDVSPHPFCAGIAPRDVRLTTHYSPTSFTRSLFGMIHEGGHGLYEQGLNNEDYGLPICSSVSLGVHESQSRLWENQVARGRPFWTYWLPRLKQCYPGQLDSVDLDAFLLAVNQVRRSLIRIEADEVTYGLHIILRFEIEVQLLAGDVGVEALPEVWSKAVEAYLGVQPGNHAEGVLQDTHWSQGLIGYFPTYLLGNLYAAQLMEKARIDIADLDDQLMQGQMLTLRDWLRENVHRVGKSKSAAELIEAVTGKTVTASPFLEYLESKFGGLYRGLS